MVQNDRLGGYLCNPRLEHRRDLKTVFRQVEFESRTPSTVGTDVALPVGRALVAPPDGRVVKLRAIGQRRRAATSDGGPGGPSLDN